MKVLLLLWLAVGVWAGDEWAEWEPGMPNCTLTLYPKDDFSCAAGGKSRSRHKSWKLWHYLLSCYGT